MTLELRDMAGCEDTGMSVTTEPNSVHSKKAIDNGDIIVKELLERLEKVQKGQQWEMVQAKFVDMSLTEEDEKMKEPVEDEDYVMV